MFTPTLAALDLSLIEQLVYMASAFYFVAGLKKLTKVKTARAGNRMASIAMLTAVLMTVYLVAVKGEVHASGMDAIRASLPWMIGGLVVGGGIGVFLAKKVEMTEMPELVAFFNGMGGASSLFVALATVVAFGSGAVPIGPDETLSVFKGADISISIGLSILIGSVTLTGSLIAYAKLSGKMWKNRFGPVGSQGLNILLAVLAIGCVVYGGFIATGGMSMTVFLALTAIALFLGVGLVVPIGGADMPVVISLLNSYSGIAAAMTGFILHNNLLIVAGMLVGAAGLILTQIMCKAMNRSLAAVLFAKFGEEDGGKDDSDYVGVTSTSAEELAPLLEAAEKVIIVPGYGLAVAQAQHKCRELGDLLGKEGIDVSYGIHPVAGRMPGHMNVLLAEADVDYDKLYDLDQINGEFKNADVVIVIGANDVCNPEAYDNPQSPIAGMPVLDVWDAQTVIVIKRSLSAGYAGIKNPLFERDNALMFFSDGKEAVEETISEYKDL